MDSRFDIHIMLPPLDEEQQELVRKVLFDNGVEGVITSSPFGSTLSMDIHEADPMDKTSHLMKLIVRELEQCMFCGGRIEWRHDHWSHATLDTNCSYGDQLLLTVPAPALQPLNEGEVGTYVMPPVGKSKYIVGSKDKASLVKRLTAVGEALRHGFGADWLAKRGEQGYGIER